VSNESLALRLYNLLSHGVDFNRVYLPMYLTRLHPLFSSELADQMYFIFQIFDSTLCGDILSKDISDILKNVLVCPTNHSQEVKSCQCSFF